MFLRVSVKTRGDRMFLQTNIDSHRDQWSVEDDDEEEEEEGCLEARGEVTGEVADFSETEVSEEETPPRLEVDSGDGLDVDENDNVFAKEVVMVLLLLLFIEVVGKEVEVVEETSLPFSFPVIS